MGDSKPRPGTSWWQHLRSFNINRIADFFFGYDFYIWCNPRDGNRYSSELAKKLKAMGFRVYLDQQTYDTHRPLHASTRRRINKSRYLLVAGNQHALDSEYLFKLVATGASLILVEMNQHIDHLEASHPLYHIIHDSRRVTRTRASSKHTPSAKTLANIQQSFNRLRQGTLRARLLSVSLMCFLVFAIWQIHIASKAVTVVSPVEHVQEQIPEIQSDIPKIQQPPTIEVPQATNNILEVTQALYDANYTIARTLEKKAQESSKAQHYGLHWLYTLSALQLDIGPDHTLPESHRALLNTPRINDVFRASWTSPASYLRDIHSVAFSPDGRYIATGSEDDRVSIWDARSGASLFILSGHTDAVVNVTFSPDGKHVASGSRDRTLRVWDVASGEVVATYTEHQESVRRVAYSPNNKYLASASTDGTILLRDASSGKVIKSLSESKNQYLGKSVSSLSFNADGSQILVGYGGSGRIQLVDVQTGLILASLYGHKNTVMSAVFSPDGQRILSASTDKTIRLWDTPSRELVQVINGHTNSISTALFTPDGKHIVSGSQKGRIRFWDAKTGELQATKKAHDGWVHLALSPDGKRIVSGSKDRTLKLWDTRTRALLARTEGHSSAIWEVAISLDGSLIASGSGDGIHSTLLIWDAHTGKQLVDIDGPEEGIFSVNFSPDNKYLVTGSHDNTLRVWDVQYGRLVHDLKGHTGAVTDAAFSPDGKYILSCSYDDTVRLWDAATGESLQVHEIPDASVINVAFSPDGTHFTAGSYDLLLRVWDTQTGQVVRTFNKELKGSFGLAFSPGGHFIATGDQDDVVRLWDIESGKELKKFRGHKDDVTDVVFTPDGKQLISSSTDYTIRRWDIESGKQLELLSGHLGGVSSLALSTDGHTLFSSSYDRTIRRWDMNSDRPAVTQAHTRPTLSAVFSPDGKHIISGSEDNSVQHWDTDFQQVATQSFLALNRKLDPVELTLVPMRHAHLEPARNQVFSLPRPHAYLNTPRPTGLGTLEWLMKEH